MEGKEPKRKHKKQRPLGYSMLEAIMCGGEHAG